MSSARINVMLRSGLLLTTLLAGCAQQKSGPGVVAAPDDVDVAYDVRGHGQPALVFIHCWSCNRNFWKHQLDAFAEDHRVVALDLPGHGRSGANRTEWTIDGLGADVAAVANHLRLKRMILIGHSMGGPVALAAARRMPDRVLGIVAVDTLHDADFAFPQAAAEAWAAQAEADFSGTLDTAVHSMFPKDADRETVQWVIDEARQTDPAAAVALIRDFYRVDLPTSFEAANVPIRAVFAKPWGPGAMQPNIEANRKYADFDAVMMEGVGHYLQLEKPDEFNAHLRRFINELAQSGGN